MKSWEFLCEWERYVLCDNWSCPSSATSNSVFKNVITKLQQVIRYRPLIISMQTQRDTVTELVMNINLDRQPEGNSLNLSYKVSVKFTLAF